jgi:hypothetical protein
MYWMQRRVVLTITVILLASGTVLAQGSQFRTVENPFQEGFDYTIGESLAPMVEIDGLRWSLVRIATKGDRDVEADKSNPVEITLEFENAATGNASVQVILLLEDARGAPLEKVEFGAVKVPAGRSKSEVQKTKVEGDALVNMTRLYLFCEVVK